MPGVALPGATAPHLRRPPVPRQRPRRLRWRERRRQHCAGRSAAPGCAHATARPPVTGAADPTNSATAPGSTFEAAAPGCALSRTKPGDRHDTPRRPDEVECPAWRLLAAPTARRRRRVPRRRHCGDALSSNPAVRLADGAGDAEPVAPDAPLALGALSVTTRDARASRAMPGLQPTLDSPLRDPLMDEGLPAAPAMSQTTLGMGPWPVERRLGCGADA